MAERPILFSGEMVRAILAGKKTQTRRPVKPQPFRDHYLQPMWGTSPDGFAFGEGGLWREVGPDYPDDESDDRRCPYGAPGDRLWCREAHVRGTMNGGDRRWVRYRATDEADVPGGTRWKPGIHMPRWASRLTLEVTAVRVERLAEISEEDARAEGIEPFGAIAADQRMPVTGERFGDGPHRCTFMCRWDEMYEPGPFEWRANPWVWVVEFRRIEAAP